MQNDALRTCSVKIAADDTNLMILEKETFDKFVGEYKTESVKSIIQFYKSCKFFSLVADHKKVELSAKSFLMKYPTNTLVIKQGETPFNIYFIASGRVRLLRRIKDSKSSVLDRGKLYQVDIIGSLYLN